MIPESLSFLKNILSGNNAVFKDNISNSYSIEKIKFNLNSKDMVGKDFYVDLTKEVEQSL